MDAVCKVEDEDMEAAARGAALDEWPPPAISSAIVDNTDDKKDCQSRLLFLVRVLESMVSYFHFLWSSAYY